MPYKAEKPKKKVSHALEPKRRRTSEPKTEVIEQLKQTMPITPEPDRKARIEEPVVRDLVEYPLTAFVFHLEELYYKHSEGDKIDKIIGELKEYKNTFVPKPKTSVWRKLFGGKK
jgi:hypothetical protein